MSLFPTPLFSFEGVGEAELDRELAGRLIRESEGAKGAWRSVPDLTRREEACYQELMRRVAARLQAVVEELARDQGAPLEGLRHRFGILAWGTVLRPGEQVLVHDHAEAHLSAIYFPSAGDAELEVFPDSGKLCFVDPRRGAAAIPGLGAAQLEIEPQNGMLVVFPGYLQHFVQPYRGGRPRVSISCNARVELDAP